MNGSLRVKKDIYEKIPLISSKTHYSKYDDPDLLDFYFHISLYGFG